MGKFTVIPQDTFESLAMDSGVLLKNFDPATAKLLDEDIITATTGGITVSCVPTYSNLASDVDNVPDNMKEFLHLDYWTTTMGFTALNTSLEFIKLALGAADVDSNKVVPRNSVSQSDFQDIWWVCDRADGGWLAARLLNALSTGGISMKTTKNGKLQSTVTLTGHVSIDAQDVVPMEFYSGEAEV